MEFLILIICTILKYIKYITILALLVGVPVEVLSTILEVVLDTPTEEIPIDPTMWVREQDRQYYYKMLEPIESIHDISEPSELNTDQRKEENDI